MALRYGATAIPIFQVIFLAIAVAGIGTLISHVQRNWKRSAVWFGVFVVTVVLGLLLLQSWNRVMLKVDADYRTKQLLRELPNLS